MMSLREKEALYTTKEEGVTTNTTTIAPSSSRQWSSGLKNPRIVRVSRTFGGKDRHSKVCTIKGLRDRRIRLSVPTAIQLYDLQDRLGLGQPSKVIDWLIDNTKNDIDKLPPLPGMPGSFSPFQDHMHTTHGYGASMPSNNPFFDANFIPLRREDGININSHSVDVNEDPSIAPKLMYWDASATMRSKQKEIEDEDDDDDDNRGPIGGSNSGHNPQVLAQNFFPIASGSNASTILPHSSLLSNNPMYNYYHNWEPSNLSLTQFGSLGLSSQNSHHHHQGNSSNNNSSSIPSPLALSARSQLFLSPSSMASNSSVFPPHASYLSTNQPQLENDIRQLSRSHVSNHNPYTASPLYNNNNSSGLGLKPFPFSMSHHPQLHQNDQDHHHQQHDKNPNDSWKDSTRN